ncbi:MAG: pectate lyase [Bacteroidales bacterium]|nr:pectate lyase [Bacteroidales bacterium]
MKRLFFSLFCVWLTMASCSAFAAETATPVPAFPGAEGFGRYTTGGRGGKVYHVTTLEDTGEAGSLRYAINQKGARIIVFDVCGTIYLNSELAIKNDNITIAGQTAPGDGICIADWPFKISANNVIIRYMRFRLGNRHVDQHEGDGLGSMDKNNIIVDHCSVSWSIDECCSVYGGKNITVQWSIVSQSLVNSGHSKGDHGYGGNWGGAGCTYAHNLLLHHTSRTPRLGPRPGTQTDERLDLRNNVIYNWSGNGCYGGEGMNVNIVNNYYKPGPATTNATVARRIASPGIRTTSYCKNSDGSWNQWYAMWHVWGDYYVVGNYNPKYADVTNDNWTYGIYNQISNSSVDNTYTQATKDTLKSDTPLPFPYVTTWSATDAYEKVLSYAGCCKPRYALNGTSGYTLKHDALDSIMIADTRSGSATFTGDKTSSGKALAQGFINSQNDVVCDVLPNAWPDLRASELEKERASVDTDKDGIPDYYESLYWSGDDVNPNDPCTKNGYTQYTNMDYYLHMIVYARVTRYISAEYTTGDYAGNCEALGDETERYVYGSSSALPATLADASAADPTCYTLYGMPVAKPQPGQVYICNNKKIYYK